MKETKENLWADYKTVSKQINDLEIADANYKMALEERDKIRNEIIKCDQLESENKRELLRNVITVLTFVGTSAITIYGIRKTFKFDDVSTVTSTLGRPILNSIIPKPFKR